MPSTVTAPPNPAETSLPARFSCTRARAKGAGHVTVTGELDIAAIPRLDRALRRAQADAGTLVVLDCRELEFIDSSGARFLLATDRRVREAGGRFVVVVRHGDDVEWLLALTGLDRALELTDQLPPMRTEAPA